ncbi:MAG TPA: deoxyribose-phosphate aldolase [Gammaproteobacteria bacterium]|nr:deoxyribose-phosphate aldolase [Gammaproteobacteria bacterium]
MNPADLKTLLNCIDLTNLNDHGNEAEIVKLCEQSTTPQGSVAAVCIYPQFVSLVWKKLIKQPIKIATVVNFPKPNQSFEKITHDIQQAILDGATEIDAVMPHDDNGEFVSHCKKLCGDKAILKIILESGELDDKTIERNSTIAIQNGADFLKTSTGKVSVGATPQAAKIMLTCIKNSGKPIGFKASGGIKTLEEAAIYVNLVREILGEAAFSSNRFRIGTSRLLEDILCAFPNPNSY